MGVGRDLIESGLVVCADQSAFAFRRLRGLYGNRRFFVVGRPYRFNKRCPFSATRPRPSTNVYRVSFVLFYSFLIGVVSIGRRWINICRVRRSVTEFFLGFFLLLLYRFCVSAFRVLRPFRICTIRLMISIDLITRLSSNQRVVPCVSTLAVGSTGGGASFAY